MSIAPSIDHAVPLLDLPSGCKLRVEELIGSPSVRSRLYSMGILPGTEMEVCRGGCGKGVVCVRVRESSLVLCERMAKAIYCRPADERESSNAEGSRDFSWGLCGQAQSCARIAPPCPCEKKEAEC